MVAVFRCVRPQFHWYQLAYATEIKSIQLHDCIRMVSPWDSIIYITLHLLHLGSIVKPVLGTDDCGWGTISRSNVVPRYARMLQYDQNFFNSSFVWARPLSTFSWRWNCISNVEPYFTTKDRNCSWELHLHLTDSSSGETGHILKYSGKAICHFPVTLPDKSYDQVVVSLTNR